MKNPCKHNWYWIGPARPPGQFLDGVEKKNEYSPSQWCDACGMLRQWAINKGWVEVPVLKPKVKKPKMVKLSPGHTKCPTCKSEFIDGSHDGPG